MEAFVFIYIVDLFILLTFYIVLTCLYWLDDEVESSAASLHSCGLLGEAPQHPRHASTPTSARLNVCTSEGRPLARPPARPLVLRAATLQPSFLCRAGARLCQYSCLRLRLRLCLHPAFPRPLPSPLPSPPSCASCASLFSRPLHPPTHPHIHPPQPWPTAMSTSSERSSAMRWIRTSAASCSRCDGH
jgi:hypothetical protein